MIFSLDLQRIGSALFWLNVRSKWDEALPKSSQIWFLAGLARVKKIFANLNAFRVVPASDWELDMDKVILPQISNNVVDAVKMMDFVGKP
jgi:hypothetical protein